MAPPPIQGQGGVHPPIQGQGVCTPPHPPSKSIPDFCRLYNERARALQSSITIFLRHPASAGFR